MDVRDRPGGAVAYELLLASTYTDESHWLFNNAVSLANERYREFNRTNFLPAQIEMPLDERYWIAELKASIVKLLEESEFVVKTKIGSIYGRLLGFARETHVRTAIKELYNEGKTNCDGKGELKDKLVTRGAGVPRKIESKRKRPAERSEG